MTDNEDRGIYTKIAAVTFGEADVQRAQALATSAHGPAPASCTTALDLADNAFHNAGFKLGSVRHDLASGDETLLYVDLAAVARNLDPDT